MNTKLAIAAISFFAVTMGLGLYSPVFAAKPDFVQKIDVCHFEGEEVLDDGSIVPAFWTIINISTNAEKAHVDKHGDETGFDFVIEDEVDLEECTSKPNFQPPEVDEE